MTPELQALARRAVACKGWRWMPGMLWWKAETVTADSETGRIEDGSEAILFHQHPEGEIPDLEDPATLGCLLSLVREAWRNPGITSGLYNPQMGQWAVYDQNGDHLLQPMEGDAPLFLTEAAALVVALERAP